MKELRDLLLGPRWVLVFVLLCQGVDWQLLLRLEERESRGDYRDAFGFSG